MSDATIALPPGGQTAPRSQFVATGLAIIAGMSLMAGLVGFYMSRRHAIDAPGQNWIPDDVVIPNAPLVMTILTGVMASVVGHWAVWAAARREQGHTLFALGGFVLLIVAFLNMIIFSMNEMDIAIGTSEWHNLAFTITGYVIALTIISLVYVMLMAIRAVGGDLGEEGAALINGSVWFWNFVVLAWSAAWYAVYVVK